MKSLITTIAALLSLALETNAQEQRVAVCTIDSARTFANFTYSFDVFARRTNPTLPIFVGTSSFFFDYNTLALSTPVLSEINPRYTGPADMTGDYLPMAVEILADKIAVSIKFIGNNSGVGAALSTVGERLFRVTMTITNLLASSNLEWDMPNSGFSTTNLQPVQHTFLGSGGGPLPVQLSSFTAVELPNRGVRLDWRTISEVNNYGFYVQKQIQNGSEWMEIANSFVAGNGTTNEPHTYSFVDNSATRGTWRYRLKQVDLDGDLHFTEPVQVTVATGVAESAPLQFALLQNYPNPFNPTTAITFSLETSGNATLEVFNAIGQKVSTLYNEFAEAGRYYTFQFEGHNLPSGVYFYRLQSGVKSELKKLMLLK